MPLVAAESGAGGEYEGVEESDGVEVTLVDSLAAGVGVVWSGAAAAAVPSLALALLDASVGAGAGAGGVALMSAPIADGSTPTVSTTTGTSGWVFGFGLAGGASW